MNWTCSSLDGYRLVSNSDAHSPPMPGREATTFGTELDYFSMADALRSGSGLAATIESYPEEGKYHLDGHRKCGVRFEPGQTKEHDGTCPECGKSLTIGVAHRVAELAGRPVGYRLPGAPGFTNLVQLPQIMGEILGIGPKSKKVVAEVSRLVAGLGPELGILCEVPVSDIGRRGGGLLAEVITRLRHGRVQREPGYDGEYGTVRLFRDRELDRSAALFDLSESGEQPGKSRSGSQEPQLAQPPQSAQRPQLAQPRPAPLRPAPLRPEPLRPEPPQPRPAQPEPVPEPRSAPLPPAPQLPSQVSHTEPAGSAGSLLNGLDPDQRAAAQAAGPLLIIAGPGTGKTRTLAHRIAHQMLGLVIPPRSARR